ncbi:diacylglycerol kinase family lipid kinase [Lutibacter sp. A64]|uniref:diacylglycerol/lipid kinase family protein n=1 Tax=Lutibacter sp. A64 TaxID=2918526 RepID=UPI001F065441|nr:diacylglycerol kinase family protein [Lutibacter sp. A64]UMB53030.1 diacylglycerol kinase family lipid kinase [Lutibacter sp. A64]
MNTKWFVIVNPTSGNGASKKKWPLIFNELKQQQFTFKFALTTHKFHAEKLVQNAINKGFIKFISVGGDGTLHAIVNGILTLNNNTATAILSEIKIGIIPIGTGNDWVKTYKISKNYKEAIKTIKTENTIQQDIGKITLKPENKVIYFNNLAGIGFDGFVVNKVHNYKNLGSLAYLIGGLIGLFSYKKPLLEITFNTTVLKSTTLLLIIGICKYSGGGMQLTKNKSTTNGSFDITFVKNITFFQLLANILGLFNGKITDKNFVENYKTNHLNIKVLDTKETYIQADGELIGSGNFKVALLPKTLSFIVPKSNKTVKS